MYVTEKFGSNLRKVRKFHGVTQRELGDIFGRHPSEITRWENGEKSPRKVEAVILANKFGLSVDDLMFGDFSLQVDR